jgi:hypothetical protein
MSKVFGDFDKSIFVVVAVDTAGKLGAKVDSPITVSNHGLRGACCGVVRMVFVLEADSARASSVKFSSTDDGCVLAQLVRDWAS